jgi:hypothetical protein
LWLAVFVIGTAKIGEMYITYKIFLAKNHLFIRWSVLGVRGNFHFGLTLVAMCVQAVTAAQHKGQHTKYLQVKQKYR